MAGVSWEELLSFVCAAAAAGGNATANVMQRKASLEQPPDLEFGLASIRDLARRRAWLLGIGGMVVSFVLQAVALGLGQLSSVEAVITLEVPLTVMIASRVFGGGLGRTEWGGIWTMTLGMIVLVGSLDPHPGDEARVGGLIYTAAGLGTVGFIAALVLAAQRGRALWRTACLGAAAGSAFGLTATLIKEVVEQLEHGGIAGMVTTWQTYAAILTGLGGVLIMQWALHTGPLLAAQPGFTLMDPLVSILWGVLVYHETVRGGWWLALALVGGAGIAAGVLTLARSPLIAEVGGDDPRPDGVADGRASELGSGR